MTSWLSSGHLSRLALAMVGCYGFLLCAGFALHIVRHPFQLNMGEGIILLEVGELARGGNIYPGGDERFLATNYGPLYYLLGAALWTKAPYSLFPLRLLSILAGLGTLLLGYGFIRTWTSSQLEAWAGATLLSFSPLLHLWGVYAKPDMPALFLSLAGLYMYARTGKGWCSLLFFLLSFYIKQSYFAAPLAMALHMTLKAFRGARWDFWQPAYRKLVLFGFSTLAAALAAFLIFEFLVFDRGEVFTHFILYNSSTYHAERYLEGLRYVYSTGLFLPLLGLLFLLPPFFQNVLFYALAITLAFHSFAVGKFGSDMNYFMEAWVYAVLLCGQGLARLPPSHKGSVFLILLAAGLLFAPYPFLSARSRMPETFVRESQAFQDRLTELCRPGDLVHSEHPGLFATIPVPVREISDDATLLHLVTVAGHVPFRKNLIERAAAAGKLAVWVRTGPMEHPLYSLAFQGASYEAYDRKNYWVYARRGPSAVSLDRPLNMTDLARE